MDNILRLFVQFSKMKVNMICTLMSCTAKKVTDFKFCRIDPIVDCEKCKKDNFCELKTRFNARRTIDVDSEEQRRLVLHSGDDIALEFQTLRQEIEALKANHTQEIQSMKTKQKQEISTLKTELMSLRKDQGSTYVRWGKRACAGNGTDKVYSGFTSGSPYPLEGGASYVCLPEHPTWAKYVDGIQNIGGYISGTEYAIDTNIFSPFPQNMHNQDAPCTVCRTQRSTTLMIPGRTDCYSGWTMEYTGYLMTGHHDHKYTSNYACVDADPDAVYHGEADLDGKLFYFTEVKCGSLPCQEYPDGRELACVVCSK